MEYQRVNWKESAETPISAVNLNRMDKAIEDLYKAICPQVGDLHITLNNTNPAERFGGEWELYAQGRALVGVGENTLYEGTANEQHFEINPEEEVGKYEQSLNIEHIPAHTHNVATAGNGVDSKGTIVQRGYQASTSVSQVATTTSGSTNPVPISTVQPSIGVFVWKRIA